MKIAISPPNERLSPGGKMLEIIRVSKVFPRD